MHWSAAVLTQSGWSVLGVVWDEDRLERDGAAAEVRRCANATLGQATPGRPVLVVAKSLGTLALPWAVENGLPGVWLTPLLQDEAVLAAVHRAQQPTLLVGGTTDPHWRPPAASGSGVAWVELLDADHGLQLAGDWRRSLLQQVPIFDRVSLFADQLMRSANAQSAASAAS